MVYLFEISTVYPKQPSSLAPIQQIVYDILCNQTKERALANLKILNYFFINSALPELLHWVARYWFDFSTKR